MLKGRTNPAANVEQQQGQAEDEQNGMVRSQSRQAAHSSQIRIPYG